MRGMPDGHRWHRVCLPVWFMITLGSMIGNDDPPPAPVSCAPSRAALIPPQITVAPGWWPRARCGLRQSGGGGGPGRRREALQFPGGQLEGFAAGGVECVRTEVAQSIWLVVGGEDLVQGVELPGMDRRFAEEAQRASELGLLTQTLGVLHVSLVDATQGRRT